MHNKRIWVFVAIAAIAISGGVGLVFNHVNAQDAIDCGDETIPVSTSILTTWSNTDFCTYTIDYSEVISGGVPRDGIPPVYPEGYTYPEKITNLGGRTPAYVVHYVSIEEGDLLFEDQVPVLVVEINDDARAYPLGVLTRHEIANTEIGGVPVAVTFCPLCNAGITFERVVNGQELHFGVSGFLRNSDLIMWDHETESWWQQATGEAIVGKLAGTQLNFVTTSMVSWGDFKTAYPDGQVFLPITSRGEVSQDYNYNPYTGYDSRSGNPFLFRGELDTRLPPTERVVGYEGENSYKAYPFSTLAEVIVVNDVVDEQPLVVFWQPGAVSALDTSQIDDAREVGSAAIFDPTLSDGTVLTFVADNTTIRDEQTGSTWNIFGQAVDGELAGTQLNQLRSVSHFWFAWAAFFPETEIWAIE
ncbi:MAG: hypothetical protein CUN55_00355 [Phototrophicales bacterium]|nr:MAG: hypothetical protein CUN55_00355 [Phototrophicales bacterium]